VRSRLSKILPLLAVVPLVVITAWAHANVRTPTPTERSESLVPRPELLRAASFGFTSLIADFYWLDAVQVVGAALTDPSEQAPLIGRLLDVVTGLDPWVDHPYRFGAVWMIDSERSVQHANELLRRGIAYHPLDWRDRFYLGFNQFFFLEQDQTAAQTLEPAARMPGAPLYLSRLVARLRLESDGLDATEMFLRELVRGAQNGFTRAEYEKALDEVETERLARLLDAAREEYRKRNGRDIRRVEDLLAGPSPVLSQLPAEPNGWQWELDPAGRIVSSYYRARYVVHRSPFDEERRRRWHALRTSETGAQ